MERRASVQVAHMWSVAIACLASVLLPLSAQADALDKWSRSQMDTNFLGYQGDRMSGVAYGDGIYVAVGYANASDEGRLQTSQDGMNWTSRTQNVSSLLLDLYDVTFANGIFVAVGYDDYNGQNIYHSTNGIDWTSHTTATANILRVTFGAGVFVAVSDGLLLGNSSVRTNRQIYTSPDGINWTARNSGSPANDVQWINDVAYGAGRFVAVDWAGHFYRSTTGTSTWTRTTNSAAGNQISFCNGLFLVPSGPGSNLLSTDGLNWALVTNNTASTFGRVIYDAGNFLALSGSKVFTSSDGTNWVQRSLPTSSDIVLTAATFSDRNVVAVGYSKPSLYLPAGFISDPLLSLRINPGFPPQLRISGVNGRTYRIEHLFNLKSNNWLSLSTFTLTNSPTTWTDLSATNSTRFYRGVLLP